MLNYTLGTIEASEALIKDLYIDLRAKVNAWSKIRKTNNITNADLCNKFADEIYLPKIVLKKADIPLSLRSQFIDLR